MADPIVAANDLAAFTALIKEIKRRLDELEKPTGTQLSKAVEKIMELLNSLETRVDEAISARSYTRAQIDAKRWPMSQVDGMVPIAQGGTGSGNAYYQDLATTTRRAAWVGDNGLIGYALSSFHRKANVQEASVPVSAWLGLPVQTYQYRDEAGELTGWDLGFIAEDVAELGLELWLYRGANGEIEGVATERLTFIHHEALRQHDQRLAHLETENTVMRELIADLSARIVALEAKE